MVSIITINYNGYKDTCELIDSLHLHETEPYEIIIVDNASSANEVEWLREKYPDITIIQSLKNLGFAGGNNLGLAHATGEYILFINNDITLDRPILRKLINRLETSDRVGAVSPKIKYEYKPDTIQYAGFMPMHPIRISNRIIGYNEKDNGQYDEAHSTAFVHGACVLTSRKILEEVGPMTEIYFLFYEELDWSFQLQKAGYETWYEPAVYVLHKESMTAKKGTPLRLYYLTRSRILFTRRNYHSIHKILAFVYLLFIAIPKNLLGYCLPFRSKMLKAYIKGCLRGFIDPINDTLSTSLRLPK